MGGEGDFCNLSTTEDIFNRVVIWPFLLFARNEMIWPLGHFFGLFSMLKKIVPFRGMF